MVTTIGAKEGLSHLMWVLVGPGDTALVPARRTPSTSTPRCSPAPTCATSGSTPPAVGRSGSPGEAFFGNLMEAWESAWPKPRVVVLSFPHNPTTECVDLDWMTRLVEFAREHEIVLVHDFAYADIAFDGYTPPSILQVPGAKDVAVELYTLTKSFSMAGWRVGFLVGNAEIVQALTKLKSYLDYGTFQPIQIAAIVAMNEAPDYPKVVNESYQARRDALCEVSTGSAGRSPRPRGRCSSGRRSPSRTGRWDRSSSPLPRARGRGGDFARRRFRPGRRRPRAVRTHRERAAHRPGRTQPTQSAGQAALTARLAGGRRSGAQGSPPPQTSTRACSIRPARLELATDSVLVGAVHHVEGAPIRATEHAGEAGLAGLHPADDLTPLGHQQALGGDGVGHPDPTGVVEADAVGRAPPEGRPARRPDSSPSSPTSKAVSRPAKVSAMIMTFPSGVMTVPLGKESPSAATWADPSGSMRTTAAVGGPGAPSAPVRPSPR